MSTFRIGARATVLLAAFAVSIPASAQVAVETGTLAAKNPPQPVAKAVKKVVPKGEAAAKPPVMPLGVPLTGSVELAPQINLSEGKSTLLRLPSPAARLAVGDPRIADVVLLNPSEVYMLGKSTGTTNLIMWNKSNDATIVDISVGLDTPGFARQVGPTACRREGRQDYHRGGHHHPFRHRLRCRQG